MGKTIDLALDFETPLGPIRGRVAVESGPMGLADLVPIAQEVTDILVQRASEREEKAGRNISCRAGCGACCRQMVPLSAPEAFYLMDMIDAYPEPRRAEILGRFEPIVNALEQHKMVDPMLGSEYSDDVALPIAQAYFSLQMPCPFLVDEACSIHPFRPVACREYTVTSPAELCGDPYINKVEKVRMPLPLSAPLARLTGKLNGSAPRLIPLVLAPRWAGEHSDLRAREWPGMELFMNFMGELGNKTESPI